MSEHIPYRERTGCLSESCVVYLCPTSNEWECLSHGGFDVCCDNQNCPSHLLKVAFPPDP